MSVPISTGVATAAQVAYTALLVKQGKEVTELATRLLQPVDGAIACIHNLANLYPQSDTKTVQALQHIVQLLERITARRGGAAMSPGEASKFFKDIYDGILVEQQNLKWNQIASLMNSTAFSDLMAANVKLLKELHEKLGSWTFSPFWKISW